MSPSGVHVPSVEENFGGNKFKDDCEVETFVILRLIKQDTDFY
jgi:hypothetical protein